jgi:hypothetical protein
MYNDYKIVNASIYEMLTKKLKEKNGFWGKNNLVKSAKFQVFHFNMFRLPVPNTDGFFILPERAMTANSGLQGQRPIVFRPISLS